MSHDTIVKLIGLKTYLEEALAGVNDQIRVLQTITTKSAGFASLKYPAKIKLLLLTDSKTVTEMVSEVIFIEGITTDNDAKRVFNGVTYAASLLHKQGVLSAKRRGKANIYSLVTTVCPD